MTEGQTMQAKNLSEKEEMSTDWLLKYRENKVSAIPKLPPTQQTLEKQTSATKIYKTYIAKYL